jgi:hypothetical protein
MRALVVYANGVVEDIEPNINNFRLPVYESKQEITATPIIKIELQKGLFNRTYFLTFEDKIYGENIEEVIVELAPEAFAKSGFIPEAGDYLVNLEGEGAIFCRKKIFESKYQLKGANRYG